MAGKIAPSPSSPFSRSVTKATARSMARLRVASRKIGLERAQHPVDAAEDLRPRATSDARPLGQCLHLVGRRHEQLVDAHALGD